jgi:hypothetical protein
MIPKKLRKDAVVPIAGALGLRELRFSGPMGPRATASARHLALNQPDPRAHRLADICISMPQLVNILVFIQVPTMLAIAST